MVSGKIWSVRTNPVSLRASGRSVRARIVENTSGLVFSQKGQVKGRTMLLLKDEQ